MTACSNDDSTVINQEVKSEFVNPMAHIGDIHNQALDAILSNCITLDSICSFTHTYIEDSFSGVATPIPQMNEFSNKTLSLAKKIGIECYYSYIARGKSESETAYSLFRDIPPQCKPFIDDMMEVINSNEADSVKIAHKFEEINIAINNSQNISDDDKHGLWTCSAIALSSYMYNLPSISSRAVTAEGVVKADLSGAVAGFLSWKFWGNTAAGLMFGPEGAVIAATKEIVRGAVAGSAVNILFGGYL
jgi:hypothetical protein